MLLSSKTFFNAIPEYAIRLLNVLIGCNNDIPYNAFFFIFSSAYLISLQSLANSYLKSCALAILSASVIPFSFFLYFFMLLLPGPIYFGFQKNNPFFNENYNYPGDFDFFIRFLYENKAIYIDECLCEYRADNPNSLSNTKVKENIVEMGDAIESLEEKYLNNETKPYFKILRSRLNLKESLHYIKMNKRIKARLVAKKYKFFRLKNLVVYLFTYLPNNLLQILLTKI